MNPGEDEQKWMTFEEYLYEMQEEINQKDNNDFSAIALEFAQNPYKYGKLMGKPTIISESWRGPCGDEIRFYLDIENGIILDGRFEVDGCATTLMAGSQTLKLIEGKSVQYAKTITEKEILNALGKFPKESEHCAILAATTLQKALEMYKQ